MSGIFLPRILAVRDTSEKNIGNGQYETKKESSRHFTKSRADCLFDSDGVTCLCV